VAVTVRAEFHSHFRELARTPRASFELERGSVAELAEALCTRYGERMRALLIDSATGELNERGTMFVDSRGRRIALEDDLPDGETVSFMVGIAGG